MRGKRWLIIAVSGLLAAGAAACGDDEEDGGGGGGRGLSGEIRIDGSGTLAPLTLKMAELFGEEHPGVTVTVGTGGTGEGFRELCAGRADVSDASSGIDPDEASECAANGVQTEQLQVANDAVTVVVNPENPVTCLTMDQLRAIWGPGSTIDSWDQVPGQPFPFDDEMTLYSPGPGSGTFDVFTEAVNGAEGAQRRDYEDTDGDHAATVTDVGNDPGGIGYVGRPILAEKQGYVKSLEIDAGEGCVAPSLETIQDATYTALPRPLFLYPSGDAVRRPEVEEFLRYYLRYVNEFAESVGVVGLNKEQLRESRTALRRLGAR
jgi:phosphate transport system substrate-binding protein